MLPGLLLKSVKDVFSYWGTHFLKEALSMKTTMRTLFGAERAKTVFLLGVTLVVLFALGGGAGTIQARAVSPQILARASGATVSWDIPIVSFPPLTISPGGQASARAEDGSKITLSGAGTFQLTGPPNVTGGGTWETFAPDGTSTARGTYEVMGKSLFVTAPGALGPGTIDNTGAVSTESAGLATLVISYSDGSRGVLTLNCALDGTPASVFEGITTTKGFVEFWNHAPDNFTIFHIVPND